MKSVSGRTTKSNQSKEKITPEKESIIKKIFAERMLGVKDDQVERGKKLNKYIKDALRNIAKVVNKNEEELKIVRQLEYND